MARPGLVLAFLLAATARVPAAERINHEGRILGPVPSVSAPILFNTPQADAVVSAMQIFPATNAWNEDVSRRPVLANSAAMIAQITADLAVSRRTLRVFQEMNYVLVPDAQARQDMRLVSYPSESDEIKPGTSDIANYPFPDNLPVETWPSGTGSLTLDEWQRDVNNTGGDRHSIVAQPGLGFIWETWQAKKILVNTPPWQSSNLAKFDLKSNTLRPAGWTSGDAAGLPMFPALVRYDECERGMVEHAVRMVAVRTRREYLYPATHFASSIPATSVNYPAMGQRFRLKASFVIPTTWTKQSIAIARALKKYGGLMADNGGFFSISACPDDRFPAGCFNDVQTLTPNDFEVVQSTGATEGPRSAGAPTAAAGADQSVSQSAGATLSGAVTGSGVTTRWYVYPYTTPPGNVTFQSASAAATTATFSAPGIYTLMLSADDGVHAVAYDAVIITVTSGTGSTTGTSTGGATTGGATTGGTSTGSTTTGSTTTGGTTTGGSTTGTTTGGTTGGATTGSATTGGTTAGTSTGGTTGGATATGTTTAGAAAPSGGGGGGGGGCFAAPAGGNGRSLGIIALGVLALVLTFTRRAIRIDKGGAGRGR